MQSSRVARTLTLTPRDDASLTAPRTKPAGRARRRPSTTGGEVSTRADGATSARPGSGGVPSRSARGVLTSAPTPGEAVPLGTSGETTRHYRRGVVVPSIRASLCSSRRQRGAITLGPRRSDVAARTPRGRPDNGGTCSGRTASAVAMRREGEAVAPCQHRSVFSGLWRQYGRSTSSVHRQNDRRTSEQDGDGV